MKKSFALVILLCTLSCLYSQNYKVQFVRGNLSDKIQAVTNSSGEERDWLCEEAISFVIENKALLGNDRELEGLAVAGILSLPNENIARKSPKEKDDYSEYLLQLFKDFSNSDTVQIAILSKINSLQRIIDTTEFSHELNNFLQNAVVGDTDFHLLSSVINSLGEFGDNVSFSILYNSYNDKRFVNYYDAIENAIINLIPISMDEVLMIIRSNDLRHINKILNLIKKNQVLSQNSMSEIAENLLNQSILLIGNSSEINNKVVDLQMESLRILDANKCTRASSTVYKFFNTAKHEYAVEIMSEAQYVEVIKAFGNIAPIDAVVPLINTLGELNNQVESNKPVSQKVALALINTIGAIGDKSAFDTLLSVTYLNYPENVLSAARTALSGLRW